MKIKIDLSGLPCVVEGEWNDYGYFQVEELHTDLGEDISPALGSLEFQDMLQEEIIYAIKRGAR